VLLLPLPWWERVGVRGFKGILEFGSVIVEEESNQKTDGSYMPHHYDEPAKDEAPAEKRPTNASRGGQKVVGWTVWLLLLLIQLLLASSVANLAVSQRAYESSRKQVKAIEQLTQSIRAVQRSLADLARMTEQSSPEDEEPEEEIGGAPTGDGSI
jgi:hypothetical protein